MRRVWMAICALVLALGCFEFPASLAARESNGTRAAKSFFDQGDAAAKAGKLPEAAAAFRRAIDADPDFVDAHQRYIETTQRQETTASGTPSVARLQQLYERWARQYPKRAAYQWALGVLTPEPDAADAFFKRALAIDPKFARAHFLLAKNADQRGDWEGQRQYLKAAAESNPEDPRYLLQYGYVQRKSDPARFRELMVQTVDTFPKSPQAAQALYYLAGESPDRERRTYYDRLRANYPVDRYNYSASAMNDLYQEITASSDALALAREMAKALPANKTWQQRVPLQEAMVQAQALVASGRFADAQALLEKTQRPSGSHGTTWTLLKADASARAGHTDEAYGTLVASAAAAPDARVESALLGYGKDLGKTPRDVDGDVWRARDGKATIAAPFQLPNARGGAPVRLADYRGRVVLVTFWYPT